MNGVHVKDRDRLAGIVVHSSKAINMSSFANIIIMNNCYLPPLNGHAETHVYTLQIPLVVFALPYINYTNLLLFLL